MSKNNDALSTKLSEAIRDVPDFPKPGIIFKDITPVLASGELFKLSIDALTAIVTPHNPTKVIGIDARGFIFGAAVADRLGIGFVPMRKTGKLPWTTLGETYALEYGDAVLEVHQDAIERGERVVVVDDLLATGGTANAAVNLIKQLGGDLRTLAFLIELDFLEGRKLFPDLETSSVLHY